VIFDHCLLYESFWSTVLYTAIKKALSPRQEHLFQSRQQHFDIRRHFSFDFGVKHSCVKALHEKNTLIAMEREVTARRHDHESKKWQRVLNLIAFWILGLCNNFGYVVMLSDANDILSEFTLVLNIDSNPGQAFAHIMLIVKTDTQIHPQAANATKGHRECNYVSTGAILVADIVPSLLIKAVSISITFYHVQ
jgi:CLN3 protein